MNKTTIAIIIALLIGLGGLAIWTSLNPDAKLNLNDYDTTKIIAADDNNGQIGDHYRGAEDAKVILVEYADLQCPGCATVMPKVSKLYKEYGDRVGFIFRNYPISGHQNARSASAAAEAAARQGFYWEMVESMYDNRADWISIFDTEKRTNIYADVFKKVAGDKADIDKFKSDLNDVNIQKKIDFDKSLGAKRDKVDATPTIIVNGEKVDIGNTDDTAKAIEEMINKKLKEAGIETGPKTEEKTEE